MTQWVGSKPENSRTFFNKSITLRSAGGAIFFAAKSECDVSALKNRANGTTRQGPCVCNKWEHRTPEHDRKTRERKIDMTNLNNEFPRILQNF